MQTPQSPAPGAVGRKAWRASFAGTHSVGLQRGLLAIGLGCLFSACGDNPPEPAVQPWSWSEGFEDAASLPELFPSDGGRWSNVQVVDPESGPNAYWLQADTVAVGAQALSMRAMPSGATLSKMDLEKQGFWAPEGSTFRAEAQFWFPAGPMPENLLLMDLECCSCWDPTVPDNQCPGIRLMFTNGDDGIDFALVEPLGYERFQIGATANPSADTAYLILDEVALRVDP